MEHVKLLTVLFLMEIVNVTSTEVNVGILFPMDESSYIQELMFEYTLNLVNNESLSSDPNSLVFKQVTRTFDQANRTAFTAQKIVCTMLSEGVAAIFGPQHESSLPIVQAICDHKEIPHVHMTWNSQQNPSSGSVNLYPNPDILAEIYVAVVREYKWQDFTILYEDSSSMILINKMLKKSNNGGAVVKIRRLNVEGPNYRTLLREIKDSNDYNIILDCSKSTLQDILIQSQQVGLLGSERSFLITNLDFQTLDLVQFQYSGTNITGFRMYDVYNITIQNLIQSLTEFSNDVIKPTTEAISTRDITLEVALTYDAVLLYTQVAKMILDNEAENVIQTPCDSMITWSHGYSILNSMKVTSVNGITGNLTFDHKGLRTTFDVQVVQLTEDGLSSIGEWNDPDKGLRIFKKEMYQELSYRRPVNELKNMTLTVMIALTPPYGMLKNTTSNLKGNDRYEGYCIDMITELSKINDFRFNIIVQEDGKSGDKKTSPDNQTVVWNGIIGNVISGVADLACSDITITQEREESVDFASPFMDLGIAILYKKPEKESPGFFSFLSPFRTEVWILVVTAYVSVSLLFFVMGRISPYEWRNPFPCVQEPDELENQFTLSNSFWFTIGALMQQGSDIAPVSVSTRLAAGVWWFFTLIMVSCYTANLAAFLTTENPHEVISNIEELATQTEIAYGAKAEGATFKFFQQSSKKLHQQMYNYMKAHEDEVLVKTTTAGVQKAVKENYAFLMETSQIEYVTERECTLYQVGKPIDSKGYGIAMKKGAWYLGIISQNILKLQETGVLSDIKRKWWKEKYTKGCPKDEANDAEKLGLPNVGGVFIVLAGGLLVAILMAVCELVTYVWSTSKEENVPMKKRLMKELKFFFRCHGTVKPAVMSEDDDSSALT